MKQTGFSAGAGLSCIILAVVTACGGSSGTGGSGGTGSTTAGSTTSKSTGTGTGTGTTATTSGATTSSTTGAGGGNCKAPGMLHPTLPAAGNNTIYCPFSGQGGNGNDSCDHTSEHCCEGVGQTPPPSSCQPKATACPPTNYMDWQCETASDCGANMDCCGDGIFKDGGMQNGMQCQNYASMMKKATCVAKGTCTTILMCNELNATANPVQCPTGKDCVPFSKAGNQVGSCQ